MIPDHDLLCGCFPCQSFSVSGKPKVCLMIYEVRCFFDVIRIIKEKQSKYILLENAKN
ncbi:MAG: DNA cytosine methyltransferase [Clostridiales bacterium]|nr:DNA cytosine methyltransferase [Clostridiales bacterium]